MYGRLWTEARDALAGVAELSRVNGGEGLDIYCINNPKYRLGLRVCSWSSFTVEETYPRQKEVEVSNFFNSLVPRGYYVRLFAISLLTPLQVRRPPAPD
jgi:hypothetical protein